MPHLTRTIALAALLLALPTASHAQGGFLKKMKDKAKEKAAEKVVQKAGQAVDKVGGTTDSASAQADSAKAAPAAKEGAATATQAAAPARGGAARRSKPLTGGGLVETPGDDAPAGAQAQQASAPTPTQGQDELNQKRWPGSKVSMDEFKATIPAITDASLDAYMRARTAMHAEAKRVYASVTGTREQRLAAKALAGAPLADDEKVVLLEYEPYLKISRKLRREYERRLDAVMERELNGAMTRLQFYQIHEMVSIFLNNEANSSTQKGPGRGLTKAELAALEKRKAELLRLRTESISEI
jgi:hypothetical protein